jgi:ABC-2 type transport system ATP-binding protein
MGHRPRLLILDEPTSGLDPIVRLEVVGAIREAADEGGRSVLFSTHIVSDLEAVADTVTVINRGRVLVSVERDELLSRWRRGESPLSLEEVFVHLVNSSDVGATREAMGR